MPAPRVPGAGALLRAPAGTESLFRDLWDSRAWRLFPLLLFYLSGVTLLAAHVPTLTSDYFASRRAGERTACETYARGEAPVACRDAHADVVLWSSWTSFFSNTVVSVVVTPAMGHFSDLHGRRPFFLLAQLATAVPLTVITLHITTGLPLLWYYAAQVATSGVSAVTVSLAFIADLIAPRHRAATFGLVIASFAVAIFIGPAAGARLAPATAAYGALATVAACSLYTMTILPESLSAEAREGAKSRGEGDGGGLAALGATWWRSIAILMRSPLFKKLTVVMMVSGVVSEGLQDLLMQYLQLKLDFTTADQGHLFMVFGAGALLVQTVVLKALLSAFGEQRVLVLGLTASLVQQLALAFVARKWVAIAVVAVGTLGSVSFPTISSIKSCACEESEQGAVQGALYGARALASGAGPLVFAWLFAAFTRTDSWTGVFFPGAPFLLGAALMTAAIGMAATIPRDAGGSRGGAKARAGLGGEQQRRQHGSDPEGGEGSLAGDSSGDDLRPSLEGDEEEALLYRGAPAPASYR